MHITYLARTCQVHYNLSMDKSDPLERVKVAYEEKRRAQARCRAEVLAARAAGLSLQQIAAAAGVTHPAIIDLIRRAQPEQLA